MRPSQRDRAWARRMLRDLDRGAASADDRVDHDVDEPWFTLPGWAGGALAELLADRGRLDRVEVR